MVVSLCTLTATPTGNRSAIAPLNNDAVKNGCQAKMLVDVTLGWV
jgi:hypothetical protein